jgi:hypothetical protein
LWKKYYETRREEAVNLDNITVDTIPNSLLRRDSSSKDLPTEDYHVDPDPVGKGLVAAQSMVNVQTVLSDDLVAAVPSDFGDRALPEDYFKWRQQLHYPPIAPYFKTSGGMVLLIAFLTTGMEVAIFIQLLLQS